MFRTGSPHAIAAAGLVDLVRRRRERPDHRVDNLAGRERQNQQSQQQIKPTICHSESPPSGEDTPTRGCTKAVKHPCHLPAHRIHFRLQPQRYKPADQISLRCLAIVLNGILSVFALRCTAKVVRFRASAIVSTLFALRTSARSFLSCSGVQGARGVPFISPSPAALQSPRSVQSSRREPAKLEPSL